MDEHARWQGKTPELNSAINMLDNIIRDMNADNMELCRTKVAQAVAMLSDVRLRLQGKPRHANTDRLSMGDIDKR